MEKKSINIVAWLALSISLVSMFSGWAIGSINKDSIQDKEIAISKNDIEYIKERLVGIEKKLNALLDLKVSKNER